MIYLFHINIGKWTTTISPAKENIAQYDFGVFPRCPLGYQGIMKIILSIDFHHHMNPCGWRRLLSQLIFFRSLQFGTSLNTVLVKVTWLASSIQKKLWTLFLCYLPHRHFTPKEMEIKNPEQFISFKAEHDNLLKLLVHISPILLSSPEDPSKNACPSTSNPGFIHPQGSKM